MMDSLSSADGYDKKLHIMRMDSTGWENEEDIFAQQCGAGIPSGENWRICGCILSCSSSMHEYEYEHWRRTISSFLGRHDFQIYILFIHITALH